MMDTDQPRTLSTVEKSWDVIDGLMELGGAGVTELANHLGISKGAIYTHLATLRERDLVVKDGETYRLALHFLNIGEFVKRRQPIYRAGKSEVDVLADETGEFAHLVVEESGRGIFVHQVSGERGIAEEYMMDKYEERSYLHQSSAGKAILAYLPDGRVAEIIEQHGLPAKTNKTITDEATLHEELEEIRAQGYALNAEENIRGALAIGVPILGEGGTVYGAVSVSCPTSRFSEEQSRDALVQKIRQTANIIEVNLQTQEPENART